MRIEKLFLYSLVMISLPSFLYGGCFLSDVGPRNDRHVYPTDTDYKNKKAYVCGKGYCDDGSIIAVDSTHFYAGNVVQGSEYPSFFKCKQGFDDKWLLVTSGDISKCNGSHGSSGVGYEGNYYIWGKKQKNVYVDVCKTEVESYNGVKCTANKQGKTYIMDDVYVFYCDRGEWGYKYIRVDLCATKPNGWFKYSVEKNHLVFYTKYKLPAEVDLSNMCWFCEDGYIWDSNAETCVVDSKKATTQKPNKQSTPAKQNTQKSEQQAKITTADDCPYTPTGITCDATLAAKKEVERSIVFFDDGVEVRACMCKEYQGAYKWVLEGYSFICNAGTPHGSSGIADSIDIKLGKARKTRNGYLFSIGGRATKISGVVPDAYWGKDLCDVCERGYYHDVDNKECKKSSYPLPCDSNQNAGDVCTFSTGAKYAVCQDIGMISNHENVLTCNANECKDDYLLQLKPDGNPSGFCIKKSDAQKSCAEKCELKLHKNPNNNAENTAYIPGDCECKQETGCKLEFNDGTVLENIGTATWFVNGVTYIKRTDGNHAEEKSLAELVAVNGKTVNVKLNPKTTYYVDFNCDGWGDDRVYFAFSCKYGHKGKNIIGNDGVSALYDECVEDETEEKPQQQTVKVAQTVTTQNDKQKEIAKAKKVLDDFYTYAKDDDNRSVWKDSEGKFNKMRLASDLTAGVVLGTVGGVVSGVVIKKKQVEKGFDALHCTVGGQTIADWGDEFRVGFNQ